MNSDTMVPVFIGLVFAAVVITFVVNAFRHGGVTGAMFGATIEETVGEFQVTDHSGASTTVKVHVLRADAGRQVGVEVARKTSASYHLIPLTLSASESKRLVQLLEMATSVRA